MSGVCQGVTGVEWAVERGEDVLSKDEKVRVLCKRFVTFPLCQGKMHKI